MNVVFLGILIITGLLLARSAYRDDRVSLSHILLGPDDKVSIMKIMQLGAFVFSSWGFIYFASKNDLPQWYFVVYMVSWAGSQLLNKFIVGSNYLKRLKK